MVTIGGFVRIDSPLFSLGCNEVSNFCKPSTLMLKIRYNNNWVGVDGFLFKIIFARIGSWGRGYWQFNIFVLISRPCWRIVLTLCFSGKSISINHQK